MITKRDGLGRIAKGSNLKHGKSDDLLYDCWINMKERCLNPKHPCFNLYGGRGIRVCDPWLNGFLNFLSDMGERPKGKSLDRVDVNGNYEPSNCRWATFHEQQRNRRDNNEIVGVVFEKNRNRWRADLSINKKKIFLGRHLTLEAAVKARQEAEEKYAI